MDDDADYRECALAVHVAATARAATEGDDERQSDAGAPPDDDVPSLATLRRQCEALLASDDIDKHHALAIQRIQHGMERLVMRCEFDKARETQALRAQLDVMQLQRSHADAVERRDSEISQLRQVLAQHQQQQPASGKRR